MRAGWKWKTWNLSLGGSRGTHGDVMQCSVHVHVTCEKRPTRRRSTVGFLVSVYGAKFVVTRRRAGSTHFVSATIAIFAVSSSPKRCTVGVIVAYALSGTPSPTDEPFGKFGQRCGRGRCERERGGRDERAAASCDGSAPHLAQVGPAQERGEHVAVVVRVHRDRLDAERAEVAHEPVPARLVLVAEAGRLALGDVHGERRGRCCGSAYGTVIPPISGKLRSQTGSWIITGHELPAVLERALSRRGGRAAR